jgi:hypothetical protein
MKSKEETLVRVSSVQPLDNLVVRLTFTDGTTGELDLTAFLRGPIFDRIRDDPKYFRQVEVDEELGTIVWPNAADVDPDVLWSAITGTPLSGN